MTDEAGSVAPGPLYGPHLTAANTSIARLIVDERLEIDRDAVPIRVLQTLAELLDQAAAGGEFAAYGKLAAEARLWWAAVNVVAPGGGGASIFDDVDAEVR